MTHSQAVGLAAATQVLVLAGGRVVHRAAGAQIGAEAVAAAVRSAQGSGGSGGLLSSGLGSGDEPDAQASGAH